MKEAAKKSDMKEIYTQSLVKSRGKKKAIHKPKLRNKMEQQNTFTGSDDESKKGPAYIDNMMFFPAISPIHNNQPTEKIENL